MAKSSGGYSGIPSTPAKPKTPVPPSRTVSTNKSASAASSGGYSGIPSSPKPVAKNVGGYSGIPSLTATGKQGTTVYGPSNNIDVGVSSAGNSSSGSSSGDSSSGGSSSGGFSLVTKQEVQAEPFTPTTISLPTPKPQIKTAPIDTVLFDDEGVAPEIMQDLIFENIGGHELINISRSTMINGQQQSYQLIKNLSSIQQQFNPNNILDLQSTSDKYFANFPIKLENKVPESGLGPNGSYVYLDNSTGNIVIEAINIEIDEEIEVEIVAGGTIYETEFGESNSW